MNLHIATMFLGIKNRLQFLYFQIYNELLQHSSKEFSVYRKIKEAWVSKSVYWLGCGLDDVVFISKQVREFISSKNVQTGSEVHQAAYAMVQIVFSQGYRGWVMKFTSHHHLKWG